MKYPPSLSEEQLEALLNNIKDWQLTHGSILKLVNSDVGHSVLASPIGVSLFPTPFPRDLFYEAISLQEVYNKLYQAVSEDEEWLYATIKTLFEYNLLAKALWDIHIEVKKEGYCQALKLDIYRSDYMLHVPPSELSDGVPQLKQVEFNTASCAGGIHANNISDMHRQLAQTGAYETPPPTGVDDTIELTATILPPNRSLKAIASGLSRAHGAYGTPKCSAALKTCVLFVVQSRNFNIADERPLEYALWEETPSIPTFRLCFGDVLEHTSLTSSRELLYHPPSRPRSSPMEVSVVYMRAGYDEMEYDNVGKMVRLRLERSRAIKCPTILSHLTTFKKVQQALATPGTLERFLSAEEAARVEKTFVPIYPMDELSDAGRHARKLAVDPTAFTKYILKPSLEGGGHNVYGDDIPGFLAQLPNELWASYILMERIQAPMPYNALISSRGTYEGRVISELGVFGICLWRAAAKEMVSEKSDAGPGIDHLSRRQHLQEASWSFKTKAADMDEMSVVKGYGCFDSPALVDSATFASCCQPEGEECSCIGAA